MRPPSAAALKPTPHERMDPGTRHLARRAFLADQYRLTAAGTERARAAGLVNADWYKPPVARALMKTLLQRSDTGAIRDTVLWYALIVTSGVLAHFALGTAWAVPAFLLYGTLYCGPADSRWHECGHGTAFKTRWMNDALYQVASFQVLRRPTVWRWSHARHHTDTLVVGRDPEIAAQVPTRWSVVLGNIAGLAHVSGELRRLLLNVAGWLDAEEETFVPESERPKIAREARIWAAIYLCVFAACIALHSIVPLLYIGLPSLYGAWLYHFFGLTQHAGLPENVTDHRLNCRTVYMNPVFRFLYWNMNYHVEHHMFPMVPYHALPRLHAALRSEMPPPYPSTLAAYREIIPALVRQTRDPGYSVERPAATDCRGRAMSQWVAAGRLDDIDDEDVRRFDHGGRTFAVYRMGSEVYASDGLCTHEQAHLADGFLFDHVIECPKHNGRFDIRDGRPLGAPVCIALRTYPAKVEGGRIFIEI